MPFLSGFCSLWFIQVPPERLLCMCVCISPIIAVSISEVFQAPAETYQADEHTKASAKHLHLLMTSHNNSGSVEGRREMYSIKTLCYLHVYTNCTAQILSQRLYLIKSRAVLRNWNAVQFQVNAPLYKFIGFEPMSLHSMEIFVEIIMHSLWYE